MSTTKQLVFGIILIVAALVMLLSSGGNILPYVGALLGLIGAVMVILSIVRSGFKNHG